MQAINRQWGAQGMANGQAVEAERRVVTDALVEPRSSLENVDSGIEVDAPTEVFACAPVTAEPKPRSTPWPPSPRPRNATSPTVRIRLADLRSAGNEHGAGQGCGEASDPSAEAPTEAAAEAEPMAASMAESIAESLAPSSPFNARTVVLTLMAVVVVMCGGALFGGPLGAVRIAEDTGTTPGAHTPRISRASVVPAALLARTPASAYPVSIERLDAPAPAGEPTDAASAANAGIPGLMGTLVPASAPGRSGTGSTAPATALSTAAR